MPLEPFKIRVHKFLISAVVSVYDENGDLVGENQLKPQAHLTVKELDLKGIAARLEDKGNAELQNKKAKEKRLPEVPGTLSAIPGQSFSK